MKIKKNLNVLIMKIQINILKIYQLNFGLLQKKQTFKKVLPLDINIFIPQAKSKTKTKRFWKLFCNIDVPMDPTKHNGIMSAGLRKYQRFTIIFSTFWRVLGMQFYDEDVCMYFMFILLCTYICIVQTPNWYPEHAFRPTSVVL